MNPQAPATEKSPFEKGDLGGFGADPAKNPPLPPFAKGGSKDKPSLQTNGKKEKNSNLTGTILEIVRMSTEDGPGIRTTVFFKGCTLSCAWCHNPESISISPQLCWIGNRCIGCRTCLETCENGALTLSEQGMAIDRTRCEGCGACAAECPGTALELLGKKWRVDELVAEVVKDRAYFEASEGGITISGGEPTLQHRFAGAFLQALREAGLHTAMDTCGQCSREALDHLLPHAALVLFDLKIMDEEAHRRFTGHSNQNIHENLLHTAHYIRSHLYPRELWIRTPVIPGATAHHDNIAAIGRFIAENIKDVVSRWELCAFNNLCRDKYLRLDRKWEFHDTPLLSEAEMNDFARTAKASGVDPDIVSWSGSARLEKKNTEEEPQGELRS